MEQETVRRKKSLGQKLQDFMASYRGKVVMNYAYSWGAAVVIAGTLFKLTHLPGANLMLWLGMGTEVLVFFISAFDLPGKSVANAAGGVIVVGDGMPQADLSQVGLGQTGPVQMPVGTMNPINVDRPSGTSPVEAPSSGIPSSVMPPQVNCQPASVIVGGGSYSSGNMVPAFTPEMEETTQAYIAQLKEMTEMLSRFTAQAESLSHDAEQMSALNRNLAGINAIYEMQLRSASTQISTIDQVHEQTRKMARQIEELNAVYARMLQAVQVK